MIVASGGRATARHMAGHRRRYSLATLEGARAHLRRRGRQVQQGSGWDGGDDEGEAGDDGGDGNRTCMCSRTWTFQKMEVAFWTVLNVKLEKRFFITDPIVMSSKGLNFRYRLVLFFLLLFISFLHSK